jgi:Zn-dependent protease
MRVGSLFGIAITVNPSWVLIFALVAYSIATPMGPLQGATLSTFERATIGAVASFLFFASVLFHELAHSLLARRRGVPVSGITLFIFGGVSSLEGEPPTAPSEAWISAVGPLTSLAIGIGFYVLALPFGARSPLGLMFGYLAFANVALAIFNILPAYPLDGGRVLHALVWRATGDRLVATRIAANIGGVIAALLIALGIGATLLTGSGAGLWTTFIGWFLLQAGNAERRQSEVKGALSGHVAGELAAAAEPRVGADETAECVLGAMRDAGARVLPVYLGDRFIGFVDRRHGESAGRRARPHVRHRYHDAGRGCGADRAVRRRQRYRTTLDEIRRAGAGRDVAERRPRRPHHPGVGHAVARLALERDALKLGARRGRLATP